MKTTCFLILNFIICASGFSSEEKNIMYSNSNSINVVSSAEIDSLIKKDFIALFLFLDENIHNYQQNPNISEVEKIKILNDFNEKLQNANSNISLCVKNLKIKEGDTIIEQRIFKVIEDKGYLELLTNKYDILKKDFLQNSTRIDKEIKEVEKTIFLIAWELAEPVYYNVLINYYNKTNGDSLSKLSEKDIVLTTDDILNKGVGEWNMWRLHNENLIPAINKFDFKDKDLSKVNFQYMTFKNYNFKNVIFDGADLQNSDLYNCDLSNVNLTNVKLTGAKANSQTKFPKGFKAKKYGVAIYK